MRRQRRALIVEQLAEYPMTIEPAPSTEVQLTDRTRVIPFGRSCERCGKPYFANLDQRFCSPACIGEMLDKPRLASTTTLVSDCGADETSRETSDVDRVTITPDTVSQQLRHDSAEGELPDCTNAPAEVMPGQLIQNGGCTAAELSIGGTGLVLYDNMCRAIADACQVDELNDIRDKARALELYAHQARNTEAERQACVIRLRAERRTGELLRDREMAKGGQASKNRSHAATGSVDKETLKEPGITKTQSSRWQQVADVPNDKFEEALAKPKPSTAAIIQQIKCPAPQQQEFADNLQRKAGLLFKRLHAFTEDDLFEEDPSELMAALPELQTGAR